MKSFIYTTFLTLTFLFTSCDKDEDIVQPINEEEVITTVNLTFTPSGGGSNVILSFKDLDGEGPGTPQVVQTGSFAQSETYNCSVAFLNEQVSPAIDITDEVEEEGADHQIFYQVTGTLPAFTYILGSNNVDANGKPIGVNTQFTTAGAATGSIVVTLRHLPNKSAAGVSDGDITNAGGSTDAEVTFTNVQIQ